MLACAVLRMYVCVCERVLRHIYIYIFTVLFGFTVLALGPGFRPIFIHSYIYINNIAAVCHLAGRSAIPACQPTARAKAWGSSRDLCSAKSGMPDTVATPWALGP